MNDEKQQRRGTDMLSDSERLIKIETTLTMFFDSFEKQRIIERVQFLERKMSFYNGAIWIIGAGWGVVTFALNKFF